MTRSEMLSLYRTEMKTYGLSPNGVLKPSTVKKMLNDDLVNLAMKNISLGATNLNHYMKKTGNDDIDIFIDSVVDNLWNPFGESCLYNTLSYGYGAFEVVYSDINGYITPTDLIIAAPEQAKYVTDDTGYIGFTCSESQSQLVPKLKSIWLYYQGSIINPYGISYLTAAYEPWYGLQNLELDMNRYFEKRGTPPVVIGYPEKPKVTSAGAIDTNKEAAETIAATFNNKSVFVKANYSPDQPNWSFEEVPFTDRSSSFEIPLDHYERSILRALGIIDRTLINSDAAGSYAEVKAKYIMFNKLVYGLYSSIIKQINNTFIKNVIDINFGIQDVYPEIILQNPDLNQEEMNAFILTKLIESNDPEIMALIDKEKLIDTLNIKKVEVEE